MKWIHQLLLLNKDSGPNTSHLLTLKISPSFTYLGIKIVPQLENIISTNYNVIIESTFKDVERWLPISLIGRINISKMNILAPPAGVFSKINSGNWNKKCPSPSFSSLSSIWPWRVKMSQPVLVLFSCSTSTNLIIYYLWNPDFLLLGNVIKSY